MGEETKNQDEGVEEGRSCEKSGRCYVVAHLRLLLRSGTLPILNTTWCYTHNARVELLEAMSSQRLTRCLCLYFAVESVVVLKAQYHLLGAKCRTLVGGRETWDEVDRKLNGRVVYHD